MSKKIKIRNGKNEDGKHVDPKDSQRDPELTEEEASKILGVIVPTGDPEKERKDFYKNIVSSGAATPNDKNVIIQNQKLKLPYDGSEPYIFVSYSHIDSEPVYDIIAQLQQRGFRVWYDTRGISGAKDYTQVIAEKIVSDKCGCVIAFVTQNYLNSDFCYDELLYARNSKKNILLAYLADVQLPPALEMRFGQLQHVSQNQYGKKIFIDEICQSKGINICKD